LGVHQIEGENNGDTARGDWKKKGITGSEKVVRGRPGQGTRPVNKVLANGSKKRPNTWKKRGEIHQDLQCKKKKPKNGDTKRETFGGVWK